jgi:hypothetical protein
MKQTILILIILFTTKLFACECEEINEKNIEKLKQKVDYIFIGKVVENINLDNNEISEILWKRNNSANEVIIKVERIIKGKIKAKYIYLNQLNAGNCSRTFKKNQNYIISGFEINEFIDLSPKTEKKRNNIEESEENEGFQIQEIPIEKIKKPEIEFKKSKFYIRNIEMNIKKWNELSKTKTVILTNSCISGTMESNFGKIITAEK